MLKANLKCRKKYKVSRKESQQRHGRYKEPVGISKTEKYINQDTHTHPSLDRLNCRIEKRVRTSELEDRKTETSQSE